MLHTHTFFLYKYNGIDSLKLFLQIQHFLFNFCTQISQKLCPHFGNTVFLILSQQIVHKSRFLSSTCILNIVCPVFSCKSLKTMQKSMKQRLSKVFWIIIGTIYKKLLKKKEKNYRRILSYSFVKKKSCEKTGMKKFQKNQIWNKTIYYRRKSPKINLNASASHRLSFFYRETFGHCVPLR